MSAVGRLWRRAPAWRMTLVAAVALTGLAAMFPPTLPPWLKLPQRFAPHPPAAAGAPAADDLMAATEPAPRYAPQPAPAPSEYGVVAFPPLGPGRNGIIPFAGRQLPLPAGTWQELVLARTGGPVTEQGALLARVEAGRLTGLLLAAAPAAVEREAEPMAGLAACFVPDAIAHQVIPTPSADGPMARECWTLTAFDRDGGKAGPRPDEVLRAGFERLDRMTVTVPSRMLAVRYIRMDATGWLTALLLLPERHGDLADTGSRLQAWIRRFAGALHKGFDGKLTAAELTPAVTRDPD